MKKLRPVKVKWIMSSLTDFNVTTWYLCILGDFILQLVITSFEHFRHLSIVKRLKFVLIKCVAVNVSVSS